MLHSLRWKIDIKKKIGFAKESKTIKRPRTNTELKQSQKVARMRRKIVLFQTAVGSVG